jgi:hypothetical protein
MLEVLQQIKTENSIEYFSECITVKKKNYRRVIAQQNIPLFFLIYIYCSYFFCSVLSVSICAQENREFFQLLGWMRLAADALELSL